MVEGGRTPLHAARERNAMGYRLVIWPNALIRFLTRQAIGFLDDLCAVGTTDPYRSRMLTFTELNALLGLPEIQTLEERYG
jgi:2-methylisocitrate lyase-like PEP mutase family enzyme